jgi:putative flippase GtrA
MELAGYGLVSLVALATDAAILWTLVKIAGWHWFPASAFAFTAGVVVAYVLSVRFVFSYCRFDSHAFAFACFFAVGAVGLLVNAAALFVAITGMGLGLMTAKLFAAVCTFVGNFALRRRLLFTPERSPR